MKEGGIRSEMLLKSNIFQALREKKTTTVLALAISHISGKQYFTATEVCEIIGHEESDIQEDVFFMNMNHRVTLRISLKGI